MGKRRGERPSAVIAALEERLRAVKLLEREAAARNTALHFEQEALAACCDLLRALRQDGTAAAAATAAATMAAAAIGGGGGGGGADATASGSSDAGSSDVCGELGGSGGSGRLLLAEAELLRVLDSLPPTLPSSAAAAAAPAAEGGMNSNNNNNHNYAGPGQGPSCHEQQQQQQQQQPVVVDVDAPLAPPGDPLWTLRTMCERGPWPRADVDALDVAALTARHTAFVRDMALQLQLVDSAFGASQQATHPALALRELVLEQIRMMYSLMQHGKMDLLVKFVYTNCATNEQPLLCPLEQSAAVAAELGLSREQRRRIAHAHDLFTRLSERVIKERVEIQRQMQHGGGGGGGSGDCSTAAAAAAAAAQASFGGGSEGDDSGGSSGQSDSAGSAGRGSAAGAGASAARSPCGGEPSAQAALDRAMSLHLNDVGDVAAQAAAARLNVLLTKEEWLGRLLANFVAGALSPRQRARQLVLSFPSTANFPALAAAVKQMVAAEEAHSGAQQQQEQQQEQQQQQQQQQVDDNDNDDDDIDDD